MLTTWQLSIEALAQRDIKVAEAVKFCAYLHFEGIKENYLEILLGIDSLAFDKCLQAIREYGLLVQEGNGFKMHSLVQAAIRYWEAMTLAGDKVFTLRLRPIADMLYNCYPHSQYSVQAYLQARAIQPHLLCILEQLTSWNTENSETGEESADAWKGALLSARAKFLFDVANDDKKALECMQQSLSFDLKVYGEDHLAFAPIYNWLGFTYFDIGSFKEARDFFQKSLNI